VNGNQKIVTVETADAKVFEQECNRLANDGYFLKTSNCGFVNSEQYDFCSSWMAIWGNFPDGE